MILAWFKDELGFLKKRPKPQPHLSPEELINPDGSDLVKTIHNSHQASILKKASIPPMKGNEGKIDLTHEETDGSSASHSSLSSSSKDDDARDKG
jgi:hypothetical protein